MPTISSKWDIVSLIQYHANVTVAGTATVRGVREIHSDCPWCPGSKDSFIMRPETGQYSHAIRSGGCGRVGDGVDFLVEYCGMTKRQAIEELGLEDVLFAESQPERTRGKYDPPPKQWQEMGKNFVERAARYLWSSSPEAAEALAYLRSRGLTDETIKRKKFGCCPLARDGRWYGTDPKEGGLEYWGLRPEDVNEKIRQRGTVLIPPGIIIPWFENEILWKIAIKRLDEPDPDRRYGQVVGSVDALYNLDAIQVGKPAMIVEAEFCAATVEQEAGDLISVVATGSADKGRNPYFVPALSLPSCLAQSFDDDEAGRKGARYWLLLYDHCFRFTPAGAKDPNDMLLVYNGKFVRNWVEVALATWESFKRLLQVS